jgi:hypothetical protein
MSTTFGDGQAPFPIGVEFLHKLYNGLSGSAYQLSSLVLCHAMYVEISDNPQKSNTSSVGVYSQVPSGSG